MGFKKIDATSGKESTGKFVKEDGDTNRQANDFKTKVANRYTETEEMIAERQAPFIEAVDAVKKSMIPQDGSPAEIMRVAKNYMGLPSGTSEIQQKIGGGAVNAVASTLESIVANPLMKLQEITSYNDPSQYLKDIVKETTQGLTGEKRGEFEDIYLKAGAPPWVAKTMGLVDSIMLFDVVTKGAIKAHTKRTESFLKNKVSQIKPPQIHGQKFIKKQGELAQDIVKGADGIIKNSMDDMYSRIGDIATSTDDVALAMANSSLTSAELKALERTYGINFNKVDSISKLRQLQLQMKSQGVSFLKKSRGKAGSAAQRKGVTSMELKDVLYDSVKKVDRKAAADLRNLDRYASRELYPLIDDMESWVGTKPTPRTEKVVGKFRDIDKTKTVTEKDILGKAKKTFEKSPKYTTDAFHNKVKTLTRKTNTLLQNLKNLQGRQLFKVRFAKAAKTAGVMAITGAGIGGVIYGGSKLLPSG